MRTPNSADKPNSYPTLLKDLKAIPLANEEEGEFKGTAMDEVHRVTGYDIASHIVQRN